MSIAAFDTLAGSSMGTTWTLDDIARELRTILVTLGATPSRRPQLKEDDDVMLDDHILDLIDELQEYAPVCTSIQWEENEVKCVPYVDDELPRYDELPDDCADDLALTVTDHGNVTLWERQVDGSYLEIWAMV